MGLFSGISGFSPTGIGAALNPGLVIGGVSTFGNTIGNYISAKEQRKSDWEINQANIDAANFTNDVNWQRQQIAWGREDNAVQRRAEDLKKAGMNPLLAAGQAAASSPAVKADPGRMEKVQGVNLFGHALSGLSEVVRTAADVKASLAQTRLTEVSAKAAEDKNVRDEVLNKATVIKMKVETGLLGKRQAIEELNRLIRDKQWDRFKKYGIDPDRNTGIEDAIAELIDAYTGRKKGGKVKHPLETDKPSKKQVDDYLKGGKK